MHRYDESDRDADGVPKQPIAFWVEEERWRAVSFDEMKLDDKTHGDGGDRAGRTERIVKVADWDDGESIGQKNATHSASMVGGSNAKHEPVPAFFSFATKNFDPSILLLGPVAVVNGVELGSQGMCNPKGSIDSEGAISFVSSSLVPMFNAHGGLSAEKKGVVTCDCVGPHMTTEFLEFCRGCHIDLNLRTPQCSQSIQFEDLVNFWQFKNGRTQEGVDCGWYKVKQQAAIEQLRATNGSSSSLSHSRQLGLLVTCWHNAFSRETNERAWSLGGFGKEGITMAPLWVQQAKESGESIAKRARSRAEKGRLSMADKATMSQQFQFDNVLTTTPFRKSAAALQKEENDAHASKDGNESEDSDEEDEHTVSTRFPAVELQLLRIPANSNAGLKVKRFHDQIVSLSL